MKKSKKWFYIIFAILLLSMAAIFIIQIVAAPKTTDWGDFDVLKDPAPAAEIPSFNGREISYAEYRDWIRWGESWFRGETFGNERLLSDITGFLNAPVDVPDGRGGMRREKFFKYFIEGIDALDSLRGNLYQGNGGGYTHDLVVSFPPGSKIHQDFPLPEALHTGLDVEAGSAWPLGIVPVAVSGEEAQLPYLLNPAAYAEGPGGVGPAPEGIKYRTGFACAICHYSLDVDWDGKTDLRSARLDAPTPGSPYQPQDAWAIGNQDLHLGWVFMSASNPLAALFASGKPGEITNKEAKQWMDKILSSYRDNPEEIREIVRGALMMPRGYFDDTPDAIHNPLQYPVLFTRRNWPFNYDGVMLNPSDRNNNVWSVSFDVSQLVGLCRDRMGKTARLLFWRESDIFGVMSAEQYADILVRYSPAVLHDPGQLETLKSDILGTGDGMPGILDNQSVVLIKEAKSAVPEEVREHPDNARFGRIRKSAEFGSDGKYRGQMAGLVGTKVITPPDIRRDFRVDELEEKYGLNGDEFVSLAVNLMLDWVEPPTNHTPLLARARQQGLVERGYMVFKEAGCAGCHAGPFFTNNRIIPLDEIGTNAARADVTGPLQTFVAPKYDPRSGQGIASGFWGFLSKYFGGQGPGYKVVTLRYLWGSAPYLHDGGVGIALKPGAVEPGDDLQQLLQRPGNDKLYGMAQILAYREAQPQSYLRPNAALSLQGLLLQSEREKVIAANKAPAYPVPSSSERVSFYEMNIQGEGHRYWVDDSPGGDRITALIAFLLALDDKPGQ